MTDADYITAFQQLLLPVAHEVTHTHTHTHTHKYYDNNNDYYVCVLSFSLSWFWSLLDLMLQSEIQR